MKKQPLRTQWKKSAEEAPLLSWEIESMGCSLADPVKARAAIRDHDGLSYPRSWLFDSASKAVSNCIWCIHTYPILSGMVTGCVLGGLLLLLHALFKQ